MSAGGALLGFLFRDRAGSPKDLWDQLKEDQEATDSAGLGRVRQGHEESRPLPRRGLLGSGKSRLRADRFSGLLGSLPLKVRALWRAASGFQKQSQQSLGAPSKVPIWLRFSPVATTSEFGKW